MECRDLVMEEWSNSQGRFSIVLGDKHGARGVRRRARAGGACVLGVPHIRCVVGILHACGVRRGRQSTDRKRHIVGVRRA